MDNLTYKALQDYINNLIDQRFSSNRTMSEFFKTAYATYITNLGMGDDTKLTMKNLIIYVSNFINFMSKHISFATTYTTVGTAPVGTTDQNAITTKVNTTQYSKTNNDTTPIENNVSPITIPHNIDEKIDISSLLSIIRCSAQNYTSVARIIQASWSGTYFCSSSSSSCSSSSSSSSSSCSYIVYMLID